MRRVFFVFAAALLILGLAELLLRVVGFRAPGPLRDTRLRISGELHGEPDAHRFWRLPGREPAFHGKAFRIICLADSVTVMDHGRGYPDDLPEALGRAGFPGQVQVFNAGVPEYTAFQGLVYLERELLAHRPDLVTVHFGVNDHWRAPGGVADARVNMPGPAALKVHRGLLFFRSYQALRVLVAARPSPGGARPYRVPPGEYRRILERMVGLARRGGARVIFVLSPYLDLGQDWAPLHRRYIRLTKVVADKLHAGVVDLTESFRFSPELFMDPSVDHIHFNRKGGRLIAAAIAEMLMDETKTSPGAGAG